jgi:hypothetical protein
VGKRVGDVPSLFKYDADGALGCKANASVPTALLANIETRTFCEYFMVVLFIAELLNPLNLELIELLFRSAVERTK